MRITETSLPGVFLIEPKVIGDARGFFLETYREQVFADAGLPTRFVQSNQSRSARGVLRGLHLQLVQPQGKLVRVTAGRVFDVAVDVRHGSPHFGRWFGNFLDDAGHRQMYIPPGFAHGFCVLSEAADFVYQCTDYYHPASEIGIAWDDPEIGIRWPDETGPWLLSARDQAHPRLRDIPAGRLPPWPGR